ncbi:hypothetical protein EB796_003465 [Bugula neritina]|uniref:Uncharacterized protein n=1 Tax=Bugula neritina TaxID=10212 RepID=A0A7J7KK35_BUGNE|nr:hypothetical protein EB796_003465 [Bugula neritina]
MLTFDLFTIVLQLSLLAAANAASQAKATVYSCSSTDLVAYTQFGVFKKVLASSNCSLLLPNSLSRSANDKVSIFIGHISTPPGSTCETEYLEISGRKFCGGTLRGAVTLTLSEDVLISFQTTSPDSRITFNLRYTVYTDVCGAPSTISQWPAILQTNISQPTPVPHS